ncbi:MAG: light-harvesting antenna LH1, beta subunit [Alphaproteobacteria bacterium]|jgi:light-harvesting complex 1 beta chain
MAEKESWSGLTDQEAQEFHSYYIQGTIAFVAVAVVAHILVWSWRPWIPGPKGYASSLIDGATSVASAVLPLIS